MNRSLLAGSLVTCTMPDRPVANTCEVVFEKRDYLPQFPRPVTYASDYLLLRDLATRGAASSPPGDLSQHLKRSLCGPDVRQEEIGVGVDDSDGSDVRQVQPLRDHLGANQDVDVVAQHLCQQ